MNALKLSLAGVLLILIGCGGGEPKNTAAGSSAKSASGSELTAFQLENGIGPITSVVNFDTLNPENVEKGEKLFVQYCSACHKVDERYIGPAMVDAVGRRTPTYMMNMILNPEEMTKKHPDAKALLAEFLAPMPNQNLTNDEAEAVLEYLLSKTK